MGSRTTNGPPILVPEIDPQTSRIAFFHTVKKIACSSVASHSTWLSTFLLPLVMMDHLRRFQQCLRLFDILRFLDDDKKLGWSHLPNEGKNGKTTGWSNCTFDEIIFFCPDTSYLKFQVLLDPNLDGNPHQAKKRSTYFEIINGFGASGSKYFKRQHLGETLRCGRGLNLPISNTIKDEKSVLKSIKSWNKLIWGGQN